MENLEDILQRNGYKKYSSDYISPMFIKDITDNGVIKYKITISYQLMLGIGRTYQIEAHFRTLKGEQVSVEYNPIEFTFKRVEEFYDLIWSKCKMGYLEEGLIYE